MKWYKHMSNMRHDPRIKRLIRKYGSEGWTVYTAIVESIVEGLDPITQIVPFLQETSEDIAFEFSIDSRRVEEITQYCQNQGLFEIDYEGVVFCFKIYNYVDEYFTKSQKNKEVYAKRNKDVISQYRENGVPAAIDALMKYMPNNSRMLLSISEAYCHTPKAITDNSGATPELLSQEEKRLEENRLEQNRLEATPECVQKKNQEPKEDQERIYHNESTLKKVFAKTKEMKSIPHERRLTVNIPNLSQVMDAMTNYTEEEILSALDNYEYIFQHRDEYRYFAYKDVCNFMTNGGLASFVDDSNPMERFRIGGIMDTSQVVTQFEEVEF